MTLASGLSYIDLHFLGEAGLIATGVLHGRQGAALIDPGPSTTLERLTTGLADMGIGTGDVRAILLTHIHLDHAGSTGRLAELCPEAEIFVHERGAPHMIDPSKLVASASRLYQADMARLWGEILPVPAGRVRVLGESARLDVVGVLRQAGGHVRPGPRDVLDDDDPVGGLPQPVDGPFGALRPDRSDGRR